jgi:hypothetical protein
VSGYTGFNQTCAIQTNAYVSDQSNGSISLNAGLADDFSGTALNGTRWSSGSWSGGAYTPLVSNGILTVPSGGWVRSQGTYTHGVIEAVAQFGNGAWEHLGFGSDSFSGNRYFIFSTLAGDGNLYARVNNNTSEQQVNLGPIPVGMHRYMVAWTAINSATDQVSFSIDGVQQAQMSVTSAGATGFYVYLSNSGSANLLVDNMEAPPPYVSSGSYTSCVLDAGASYGSWQQAKWLGSMPANTSVTLEFRTSSDGVNWGGWNVIAGGNGAVTNPDRYGQYRLTLGTTNSLASPLVNTVSLTYQQIVGP